MLTMQPPLVTAQDAARRGAVCRATKTDYYTAGCTCRVNLRRALIREPECGAYNTNYGSDLSDVRRSWIGVPCVCQVSVILDYSDVFRVGRRQASPRTAVRAHSAMDRDTVRWHNLVRKVIRYLALQSLATFSGVLLRWLVRQRALATADGSTAAVSASTPASAGDLLGEAIYHRSRWFVGVAKTAFGFVLTGASRWAMGTYVEVGEYKTV